MRELTKGQIKSRQQTLLAAMLLSMWAPLTTGLAVYLSHSTTQLADFIRRTIELLALFVSWLVFRHLGARPNIPKEQKVKLERIAGLTVFGAMVSSGMVMFFLGLSRIHSFVPGGNVYPGLAIALLGLIVNTWFWRRYAKFHREEPQAVIMVQEQLYRAKAVMDLCVLVALSSVAIDPNHPIAKYLDILGSLLVGVYLVGSGIKTLRELPKRY